MHLGQNETVAAVAALSFPLPVTMFLSACLPITDTLVLYNTLCSLGLPITNEGICHMACRAVVSLHCAIDTMGHGWAQHG